MNRDPAEWAIDLVREYRALGEQTAHVTVDMVESMTQSEVEWVTKRIDRRREIRRNLPTLVLLAGGVVEMGDSEYLRSVMSGRFLEMEFCGMDWWDKQDGRGRKIGPHGHAKLKAESQRLAAKLLEQRKP